MAAPTRTEILLMALVKLGEIGQEKAREFLDQQAVLTVACLASSPLAGGVNQVGR